MPDAALSGHDDRQVYFNVSENAFFLNPKAFFDRVKEIILSDFATYLGLLSPAHELPREISPTTAVSHVTPTIGLRVMRSENDQP